MTTTTTHRTGIGPSPHVLGAVLGAAVTYATIALPISMLGVMWPVAREELGASVGALGLVAAVYGLARMSASTTGAATCRRLGAGRGLAAGLVALTVTTSGLALAHDLATFTVAVGLVGAVSGWLSSIVAVVLADRGSVRAAGLVHGSHGLGATVAPIALATIGEWRTAVAATGVVAIIAAVVAVAGHGRDVSPQLDRQDDRAAARRPQQDAAALGAGRSDLRRRVALSLALFVVVAGVEVSIGQWTHVFLTGHKGLSQDVAAAAVAAFWGGATVGRLLLTTRSVSTVVGRLGLAHVVASQVLLLATVVVGIPTGAVVAILGLLGLASAPTIPTLDATTGLRVGPAAAPRVAGWQALAFGFGAVTVTAVSGLLVDHTGPGASLVLPLLLGLAAIPLLRVEGRSRGRSGAGHARGAQRPRLTSRAAHRHRLRRSLPIPTVGLTTTPR